MNKISFLVYGTEKEGKKDRKNKLVLHKSSWDDWYEFETLHDLYYHDNDEEITYLGSVKIGKVGMTGARHSHKELADQRKTKVPDEFEYLSSDYFSLGQDSSFYSNLYLLGANLKDEVLKALNDIVYSEEAFDIAIEERVTNLSLLRSVSVLSIKGQYKRITLGQGRDIGYSLKYTSAEDPKTPSFSMDFHVSPKSNPPTNVQVIIGRNGVGKTRLLKQMVNSIIESDKEYGNFVVETSDKENALDGFANVMFVSFSAFDNSRPFKETKRSASKIKHSYIGLKKKSDSSSSESKSKIELGKEFYESLKSCIALNKLDLWRRLLKILEYDNIFNEANINQLTKLDPYSIRFRLEAKNIFKRLSSGHSIVLLTMTRLVETIEERSLVLMDEPESHLHPPLQSAFIRAISDLMTHRNGVAILATHSPVMLQEVPKSSVWVLNRTGSYVNTERLEGETFGENLGILTRSVFGLEVTKSGFHKTLSEVVDNCETSEEIYEIFNNEIGMEGRAIVESLMFNKNKK